jgi:hypothetical protein
MRPGQALGFRPSPPRRLRTSARLVRGCSTGTAAAATAAFSVRTAVRHVPASLVTGPSGPAASACSASARTSSQGLVTAPEGGPGRGDGGLHGVSVASHGLYLSIAVFGSGGGFPGRGRGEHYPESCRGGPFAAAPTPYGPRTANRRVHRPHHPHGMGTAASY